jgi:hypothetical protein
MFYPFLIVRLTMYYTRSTQVLRVLVEREASWSWTRSWTDCEENISDNTARSVDLTRAAVLGRLTRVKVEQTNGALLPTRHLGQTRRKESAVFDKSPDTGRVSSPEPLSAGMPTFARTFSNEGPVNHRETMAGSKSPRTPDTHDG